MRRRLALRAEALTELAYGDLAGIAGAAVETLPLQFCLFSAHVYGCNPSQPPHCTA